MSGVSSLTERFAIPGQIDFKQDPGGLLLVDVANEEATATLAMQGAHLMRWAPRGEPSVLWLSPSAVLAPGKAIRGGVPICWPWFGPHDSQGNFPSHGFARTAPWEIIDGSQRTDGATRLRFRLAPGKAQQACWPYPSEVQLHIAVGEALELELVTRNGGDKPFTFGAALHSYFAVSDARRIALHGLDGLPFIDKLAGGKRVPGRRGPLCLDGELDRIYLDSTADCVIEDPGLQRRIRIEKHGSRSTVVWNPWRDKAAGLGDMGQDDYLGMLCVESGNVADDVVTLAPEAKHRLWVRYSVERD